MPETTVPGIAAKRVVIEDGCRAVHGDTGAFNKAALTLLSEYDEIVRRRGKEKGVNYHLVLTVEDTKRAKDPRKRPTEILAQHALPVAPLSDTLPPDDPKPSRPEVPVDARCCHLQCTKLAEWVIVSGPTTDDCTNACTEHLVELLSDAKEHRVYPIKARKKKRKGCGSCRNDITVSPEKEDPNPCEGCEDGSNWKPRETPLGDGITGCGA